MLMAQIPGMLTLEGLTTEPRNNGGLASQVECLVGSVRLITFLGRCLVEDRFPQALRSLSLSLCLVARAVVVGYRSRIQ